MDHDPTDDPSMPDPVDADDFSAAPTPDLPNIDPVELAPEPAPVFDAPDLSGLQDLPSLDPDPDWDQPDDPQQIDSPPRLVPEQSAPTQDPGVDLGVDAEQPADVQDLSTPDLGHQEGPDLVDLQLEEPLSRGGDDLDQGPGFDLDADGDPPDLDDGIQLSGDLDLDGAETTRILDGNAWIGPGIVAVGAAAIGLSGRIARRFGRSTPNELSAELEELGIDARVEHLDLTGLEELLADGRSVLMSTDGSAGVDEDAVLRLRSLERLERYIVVTDRRGRSFSVDLDRFEAAWSDTANQVVVAANQEARVALVPVVLGHGDLVSAR